MKLLWSICDSLRFLARDRRLLDVDLVEPLFNSLQLLFALL